MRRAVAAVALITLAALVPVACSDDGPGAGEARLQVDGEAFVERADGSGETVRDNTDLKPGDRVEMVEGTAVMALHGDTRFELREGHDDAAPSRVLMGEVPELEGGDLLVLAPDETSIEAEDTLISLRGGAAKLSRSFGVSAAAYDADIALDSAGELVEVPALRQVHVPALGLPRPVRPFAYDEGDSWDRRFLGDAIDLGRQLARVASGYTASLNPGEGRSPGFFRIVLPGLDDEEAFTRELIDPELPPGETLVGAAITELGERGDFVARWRSVFQFRGEGAEWGLVALDQAVSRGPLLGTLEQALDASPLAFAESPPSTVPPSDGGPDDTPTTLPPVTLPPTTTPPTTTPPTTEPPIVEPPPTPLDPVVDPIAEVLGGIVEGLLGLLDPPPP